MGIKEASFQLEGKTTFNNRKNICNILLIVPSELTATHLALKITLAISLIDTDQKGVKF